MAANKYSVISTILVILIIAITAQRQINIGHQENLVCLREKYYYETCKIKPRRYDILDMGYKDYFSGWVDVQGQGAANDYCRILGKPPEVYLSCALAGTAGESDRNYNSAKYGFDTGHNSTWYMKDEDGDGRDDYCRCMGSNDSKHLIFCTKAGPNGFYGSEEQPGPTNTFSPSGPLKCSCTSIKVSPETGISYFINL